jgi:alkanesulfonate monooxygenase SsuD/methylene tetrahydromethanopterin reductase-like flavin-dependent oxidoreductase (luciferase family)
MSTSPADRSPAPTLPTDGARAADGTAAGRAVPRLAVVAQVDHGDLDAGTSLFRAAEALGYDAGYVRARHLQQALSSPLLFLVALAQRTARIELGTAVIPLRFENAGRLAEDLATAHLLTGGRLRAGLGPGYSAHDAMYARAFGTLHGDHRDHVDRILHDLLSFVDGEIVAGADSHVEEVEPGTPLRLQPQVPGLREHLAYGAASPERAAMAGRLGLGLQLATMAPDDGSGRPFEQLQLEALRAYREASLAAGHGAGRVMVSRQMLPVRDEAELERYTTLIPRERSAEPGVLAEHHRTELGGRGAVYGPVVLDEPGVVAQALLADPVVLEADELALVIPAGSTLEDSTRVLSTFARHVLPHLLVALP